MTQRNFVLPVPSLPLIALLALALAACQPPPDDTNIAIDNGTNVAEAANAEVETFPPDDSAAAASNAPAATPTSEAPTRLPTQIPAAFRGRWGINRADCTSTRGDAKGLLTIDNARLTLYESRGTLAKVLAATAGSFEARFGFSGEGQTWQRTERLTLVDNKLQRRTDAEPGQEPPVRLTYERCPA